MIDLAVKEGGVYFGVPDEEGVYHGVDLSSALESGGIAVHGLEFETQEVALAGHQADHEIPFGGGVAVESHDYAFFLRLFGNGGDKLLCHVGSAASNYGVNSLFA